MLSRSRAGARKTDGWTSRRGNRSSSILRTGVSGRIARRTEIASTIHSSLSSCAKSFASLASSSASSLAMVRRFDASASSFSRFR
jgi:hypothetical protein